MKDYWLNHPRIIRPLDNNNAGCTVFDRLTKLEVAYTNSGITVRSFLHMASLAASRELQLLVAYTTLPVLTTAVIGGQSF
jgi:hypothetical protein